jgi:hypothetical protein
MTLTTGRRAWLAVVALLGGATVVSFFGPWGDRTFEHPQLLFAMVITSALLCVAAATVVIALADRRELAELGLLGSALMAASVMPLVHGLVTPDVLYDGTEAFRTSVFLSLPIALAAGAPLLTPHSAFGRWASRHWRDWSLLCLLGVFAIGAVVVSYPDTIGMPSPSSPVTIAVCAALTAGVLAISLRQLRFYELGNQPANLGASVSLVLLADTALLPLIGDDYSLAFWWLHVVGVAGVLGACVAMAASKRMSRTASSRRVPAERTAGRVRISTFSTNRNGVPDSIACSTFCTAAIVPDVCTRTPTRVRLPSRLPGRICVLFSSPCAASSTVFSRLWICAAASESLEPLRKPPSLSLLCFSFARIAFSPSRLPAATSAWRSRMRVWSSCWLAAP